MRKNDAFGEIAEKNLHLPGGQQDDLPERPERLRPAASGDQSILRHRQDGRFR